MIRRSPWQRDRSPPERKEPRHQELQKEKEPRKEKAAEGEGTTEEEGAAERKERGGKGKSFRVSASDRNRLVWHELYGEDPIPPEYETDYAARQAAEPPRLRHCRRRQRLCRFCRNFRLAAAAAFSATTPVFLPPLPLQSLLPAQTLAWAACERKQMEGTTRKAVNRVLRDERLEKALALKGLPTTPTPSGENDTEACLRLIARALTKGAIPAAAAKGQEVPSPS